MHECRGGRGFCIGKTAQFQFCDVLDSRHLLVRQSPGCARAMMSQEPSGVQNMDDQQIAAFDFAEVSSPSKRSATDSDLSRHPSTEQLQLQEHDVASLMASPAGTRKERKLSGRTANAAARQNFVAGFPTVESLEQWPTELLQRIFGIEQGDTGFHRRRRLEASLQYGLVLHTDFSGKGSVEQALRMFDVAGKDCSPGSEFLGLVFQFPVSWH